MKPSTRPCLPGVTPVAGRRGLYQSGNRPGLRLSDALGVAGFPSGEAYKIGASLHYFRLQRLFCSLDKVPFDLGGDAENIEPAANQLGGAHHGPTNFVLTAGKISDRRISSTPTAMPTIPGMIS